jgi:hypothetical protein
MSGLAGLCYPLQVYSVVVFNFFSLFSGRKDLRRSQRVSRMGSDCPVLNHPGLSIVCMSLSSSSALGIEAIGIGSYWSRLFLFEATSRCVGSRNISLVD